MLTVIRQPNNKIYTEGKNPPCIQCSVTECGRPGLFPQEWDAICESSRKCELMRGVNWITIDTGGNYMWGCVGPQTHNRRRRRSIHATGLAQYLALSSALTSLIIHHLELLIHPLRHLSTNNKHSLPPTMVWPTTTTTTTTTPTTATTPTRTTTETTETRATTETTATTAIIEITETSGTS